MSDSKKPTNSRRQFVKRSLLGAGSISMFKLIPSAAAQGSLPAINSLLLDDSFNEDVQVFSPLEGTNGPQTVEVPAAAKSMTVKVVAGGGSGAGVREAAVETSGGAGGDGAVFYRSGIDVSEMTELTLQIGEGAKAAESNEISQPGEFGGGAAGSAFGGAFSSTGGSGGGYSAIINGIDMLVVVPGGGGGGGSHALTNNSGGRGGDGNEDGFDGFAPAENSSGGGFTDGEGGSPDGGDGFGSTEGDPLIFDPSTVIGTGGDGARNTTEGNNASGGGGGGGGGFNGGGGGGSFTGLEGNTGGGGGGGAGGDYYLGLGAGETYTELNSGGMGSFDTTTNAGQPGRIEITFSKSEPQAVLPLVQDISIELLMMNSADIEFTIVSDGGAPIASCTVEVSTSSDGSNPVIFPGNTAIGVQRVSLTNLTPGTQYYAFVNTSNAAGDTSSSVSFTTQIPCLVKGTPCRLANGIDINIEDVTYNDELMVWNFDEGKLDSAKPVWIKVVQTAERYGQVKFSDGSQLGVVENHRVFNQQKNTFTYLMHDDTPVGTITIDANGKQVSVVSKKWVEEPVNVYNVITAEHLNLFAGGVLTSCRLNNLYPIEDMRFAKGDRVAKQLTEFTGVSPEMFNGLRLAEQPIPTADLQAYVDRMNLLEVSRFTQILDLSKSESVSQPTI